MYKMNILASCNGKVLPLLTRKEVPRAMVLLVPLLRNTRSSYSTISPLSISEQRHGYHQKMIAVPQKFYSNLKSIVTHPSDAEVNQNRKIMLTTSVQGQLELYRSVQESVNIVSKVAFLFNIAKIVARDQTQQEILKQEIEHFKQGNSSAYADLLESIAKTIDNCQCRHLANVVWALGKIKDKDNRLIQVCRSEILCRDILSLKFAEICQIVNGFANLGIKAPEVFGNFQEAILSEKLSSKELEDQHISGILMSYAKMNNGSEELFDYFLREVVSRNMAVNSRALADMVWSFAKKGIDSNSIFSLVEAEVIRRGASNFENVDMVKILWAFSTGGKGNIQLFYLLDSELISRGLNNFLDIELVEIIWSFARRNVTNAKILDVAEREILNRGVSGFRTHELVLILYSFVRAKRDGVNINFVKNIEAELCLRSTKEFDSGHLSQMIWSLGRLNMSESKLFEVAEAEVLKCNMHKVPRAGKLMLIRGFIKAQRGSKQLYQSLYSSISAKDLSNLNEAQICEFVWCFSLANIQADKLFDFLEKEILNSTKYHFTSKQRSVILKSFLRAGKGSKALLNFLKQF